MYRLSKSQSNSLDVVRLKVEVVRGGEDLNLTQQTSRHIPQEVQPMHAINAMLVKTV